MKHTPEPWDMQNKGNLYGNSARLEIVQGVNVTERKMLPTVLRMPDLSELSYANAERIVACVNACKGIPTTELSGDAIWQLIEVAASAADTIDVLCSALDENQIAGAATGREAIDSLNAVLGAMGIERDIYGRVKHA